MITPTASKSQFITRHLGGLSAIHANDVQTVIWSRRLARSLRQELDGIKKRDEAVSFVTLAADPFERVQQQLRKEGLSAHQLTHDIALLVTVFGELSGASRITVSLQSGGTPSRHTGDGLRMVAAYGANRRTSDKPERMADYVGIFRDDWFKDHPLAHPPSGLRVCFEKATDTTAHRRSVASGRASLE